MVKDKYAEDFHFHYYINLFLILIFVMAVISLIDASRVNDRLDDMEEYLNLTVEEVEEVEEPIEYTIDYYVVLPYSNAYVWADGVVTCQEYINKSHSYYNPHEGMVFDEVANNNNYSINCAYKVEVDA